MISMTISEAEKEYGKDQIDCIRDRIAEGKISGFPCTVRLENRKCEKKGFYKFHELIPWWNSIMGFFNTPPEMQQSHIVNLREDPKE